MVYKDQNNNVVHDFRDVSETAASRLSGKSRYKRKQTEHLTRHASTGGIKHCTNFTRAATTRQRSCKVLLQVSESIRRS